MREKYTVEGQGGQQIKNFRNYLSCFYGFFLMLGVLWLLDLSGALWLSRMAFFEQETFRRYLMIEVVWGLAANILRVAAFLIACRRGRPYMDHAGHSFVMVLGISVIGIYFVQELSKMSYLTKYWVLMSFDVVNVHYVSILFLLLFAFLTGERMLKRIAVSVLGICCLLSMTGIVLLGYDLGQGFRLSLGLYGNSILSSTIEQSMQMNLSDLLASFFCGVSYTAVGAGLFKYRKLAAEEQRRGLEVPVEVKAEVLAELQEGENPLDAEQSDMPFSRSDHRNYE